MVVQEELKIMPFGEVWEEYCRSCQKPADGVWYPAIEAYERDVLSLTSEAFTRELWEMETECPIVFPQGVGVVPWMVPGGRDIAVATSELMDTFDVVIWAHRGMFCAGPDFDTAFGLMHTVEKAAEILVKVRSMAPQKRQTITPEQFRELAKEFGAPLPEQYIFER